jgi:hypothetical protein
MKQDIKINKLPQRLEEHINKIYAIKVEYAIAVQLASPFLNIACGVPLCKE